MTKHIIRRRELGYCQGRADTVTPFGRMLYHSISEAGMTASKFSRKAKTTSGFLSGIYQGKKKPTLKALDKWCRILGLEGNQREEFVLLADLEHTPERVLLRLCAASEFTALTYSKWASEAGEEDG